MVAPKIDQKITAAVVANSKNIQSYLQKVKVEQFIVLPVISSQVDPELLAKLITEVAAYADEVTTLRRAKKLKSLVELLTPDIDNPRTLFIEANMIAQAQRHVLESAAWLTAAQLSKLAGFSARNPSVQPNKWKLKKQIFAIQIKGIDYFPQYALSPQNNYRPLSIVGEILEVFNGSKDGWGMAYWFASINGYLDDRAPQDLILTDPQLVLKAAKVAAIGVCHG